MKKSIISVNRTTPLDYLGSNHRVLHPELEVIGPAKYDLSQIQLYLHPEQKKGGSIRGKRLYVHLKDTNTLQRCLGFHDILEIQKKGVHVFQKFFGNNYVFCWKSAIKNGMGLTHVPCFYCRDDAVLTSWTWVEENTWSDNQPAARFPARLRKIE